jgi:hypothetical protein
MRNTFCVLLLSLLSPLVALAQTPPLPPPPPLPSDFDSSVPAPKNLPAKLNIPANTRIEVTGARRNPIYRPPAQNAQRLLYAPDLVSAVIERGSSDVHATFQWEGGRSSEAFIIHDVCFRTPCLAFPDSITIAPPYICFQLNSQNSNDGSGGSFPSISWYKPSTFAGKATVNGNRVLVFAPSQEKQNANAPGTEKPSTDTYPDGDSICLDATTLLPVWIADDKFVYTFTYIAAPNVQIEPKGMMLTVIQRQFGHYP